MLFFIIPLGYLEQDRKLQYWAAPGTLNAALIPLDGPL